MLLLIYTFFLHIHIVETIVYVVFKCCHIFYKLVYHKYEYETNTLYKKMVIFIFVCFMKLSTKKKKKTHLCIWNFSLRFFSFSYVLAWSGGAGIGHHFDLHFCIHLTKYETNSR